MASRRFLHFGFRVHDIDATMKAYEDLLGIAWDPVHEYDIPRGGADGGVSRSKVTHGKTDDGVEIEIVQYLEGAPVDENVLAGREGISHIAFVVDNLEAERTLARAKGIAIVGEGSVPRASWIFLHHKRLGGALVQLVQFNQAG